MHLLTVAILCLTFFVDTAKACWFLRACRRPVACRPIQCQPILQTSCPPCGEMVACHPGGDAVVSESVHTGPATQAATEPAPDADNRPVVVHDATTVVGTPTTQPPAVSVVAPPEPATPVVPPPMPLDGVVTPPTEPVATKPAAPPGPAVAPASNDEPIVDEAKPRLPAPAPAAAVDTPPASRPPAAPAPDDVPPPAPTPVPVDGLVGEPAVPAPAPLRREANLFDLYSDEEPEDGPENATGKNRRDEEMVDRENGDDAAAPEDERPEVPRPIPASEETDEDAADAAPPKPTRAVPAADAAPENDDASADPRPTESPAAGADAVPEKAPAGEDAATRHGTTPDSSAVASPGEPMRRWSDPTGRQQTEGWLVELIHTGDRGFVRILKLNGRHTTVPIRALSETDQDYVSEVQTRLANGGGPAATDTAGL